MPKREIQYGPIFCKNLKYLGRKYKGLGPIVDATLKTYIKSGPTETSRKIPNLGGKPVFKDRIPIPGKGKRGGVRIIYYCDHERLIPLYAYAKSETIDLPMDEIEKALESLLPFHEVKPL